MTEALERRFNEVGWTPSSRAGSFKMIAWVRGFGRYLISWGTRWEACQDWANTKAAYRFLSNRRVGEHAMLRGHFEATRDRFAATVGPILVLQDTTELTYQREKPELFGITENVNSGRNKEGWLRHHAIRGLPNHSSLAVTVNGTPLALAAVKL